METIADHKVLRKSRKGLVYHQYVGKTWGGATIHDVRLHKDRLIFYIKCGCQSYFTRACNEVVRLFKGQRIPSHGKLLCPSCRSKFVGKDKRSAHPLYDTYNNMMQRCFNPNNPGYFRYGGRGITVCKEWADNPHQFYKDMGYKPSPNHSLDRIDNNGDYSYANCRWATPKEQASNQRKLVYYLEDEEYNHYLKLKEKYERSRD